MANVAFIIFLNDSARGVVLDDENKAKKELERLKKEYKAVSYVRDEETFDHINYWHIKDVRVLN